MMKLIILALTIFSLNAQAKILQSDLKQYFDMAAMTDSTKTDPLVSPMYQFPYTKKPDFAKLEYTKPLDKNLLLRLTPDDVLSFDQEQFDQLYSRLTAGYIPDGVFDGKARVLPNSAFARIVKTFTQDKDAEKFFKLLRKAGLEVPKDERGVENLIGVLANTLWKGKQFYKADGVLRNVIPVNDAAGAILQVMVKGFDPKKLPVETVTIQGKSVQAWKLFPARLYCGQSLLDSRRESVIIDYAYSERITKFYQPEIDFLASRNGLYVRDEIRMVRPGFYVGKAYVGRTFFLTFTMYNEAIDKQKNMNWTGIQECWNGTQKVAYLGKE